MYVGHTHSTRRQMYIVCVCVSSTLRVPFRYPSGSLLRSKLDPLASMGWFAAAWALLAVAPGPSEPEARNGFPSGNVLPIPDSNVTFVASPRAQFRLDESCSSNSAPGLEGFYFSPPRTAATVGPSAHTLGSLARITRRSGIARFGPLFDDLLLKLGKISPLWPHSMLNAEHNSTRFSPPTPPRYLDEGPGPPRPNSETLLGAATTPSVSCCGRGNTVLPARHSCKV